MLERRTHDYVRGGTTNLYAALDIASGQVITDMTERHRAVEFRRFLNLINRSVAEDLDVHVVVDNSSPTRLPRSIAGCCAIPASPFTSPAYSSWVNLNRALVRRADQQMAATWHASLHQRTRRVLAGWITTWNDDPKPFVWPKSADEILDTLVTYCARISDSRH